MHFNPNAELKIVKLFLSIPFLAKSSLLLSLLENRTIIGGCALFSCLLDTGSCY